MKYKTYGSTQEALSATDEFYENKEGFEYNEDLVNKWLSQYVRIPKSGRVLDLCCGDGIWSKGFKNLNSKLDLYGIDISEGGINKARKLLNTGADKFVLGDAEKNLPFNDGFFQMIFSRGPGLYNQHDMDRPAAIEIISNWHKKLAPDGLMYSIFASTPSKVGTYTSMDDAKLPYNRCPRKTEAVDFLGGKYHHDIKSFTAPFWKAADVNVLEYSFVRNMHILVTKRID
jgi:SAM-dependent methyltransferase